jgi:hypothetical protein
VVFLNFAISLVNGAVLESEIGFVLPFVELVLVAVLLALGLTIWLVGMWRSAKKGRLGTKRGALLIVQAAVVVLAVFFAKAYFTYVVPLFPDAFSDLLEDPSWGARSVSFSDGGGTLSVNGYITRSIAKDVKAGFEGSSHIRLVVLNSDGGRLRPALEVMRLLRRHGVDTYVPEQCVSACALVFLGGRHREMAANARLGFHAPYAGNTVETSGNDELISEIAMGGISSTFLRRALTEDEVWYPNRSELVSARVLTAADR